MNINDQILNIKGMLTSLPEGEQKDYFKDFISRVESGEKVDPIEFINGMDNGAFKGLDLEALKAKEQQANQIFKSWAK